MKLLLFISSISLAIVTLVSCTKLEREDYQNIPFNQFFKTEDDAKAAVTDYYSTAVLGLWNAGYQNPGLMGESQTEIMEFAYDGNLGYFTNHFFLNASQYRSSLGDILASYSTIVKHISRGTNLIPQLEKVPMNTELRKRYIAEIRVLRAHCALWGYYMYGGVELFLDPEVLADVENRNFQPRATKAEMAKFIISEIDAVKNDLALKYGKNEANYGRVTQGAALTIKLKIQMQEKMFVEAETTAREIMTIGYDLVPRYADIFTLANEGNIETIWSVPCLTNLIPANTFLQIMLPYDYPSRNPNINKYGVWGIRWGFYDSFDPLDERRKQIAATYTTSSGQVIKRGEGELQKGAVVLKYEEDPGMTGGLSGVDWILFRYADVLLLLAEAINEKNGGPTQEAVTLVNRIRQRAFPNQPQKLLQLSEFAGNKSKFNDAILAERGWELFMEYHRRQDLIRHNKFIERAMTVTPRGPIADFILLWPIPPSIVDQSKGIVAQNPGY
jgi:hypothetical protein